MGFGLTKVFKYGAPIDPQAWNRMKNAEQSRGVLDAAGNADNYRLGVAGNINDIATGRRQSFDQNYQPIFDKLTSEVQSGYTPDYQGISDQAKQDVLNAYGRARQITAQRMSRYGVPPVANQQDINANQLSQTADQVQGSNMATDAARTRSQALEATRPGQVMALGLGIPGSAAAGYRVGGGTVSNIMDKGVAGDYQAFQGKLGFDQAGGHALGSLAGSLTGGSFADGGEVGEDGDYVQLESGDVVIPSDVVDKFGPEFFDALVQHFSGGQ